MADQNLNAIPGETALQYETRLGAMNKGAGTGFGNPLNQQKTDTGELETPTAYNARLAALVKNPLEDAANAGGASLNGNPVPVRGAPDSTTPPPDNSNFSINELLNKIGSEPTPPSAVDTYNTLSQEQGIPG